MFIPTDKNKENSKPEIVEHSFATPLGEVYVLKSGIKIPFEYTTIKHTFRNGISTDIYRIKIDTRNHSVNDEFEIRVGNINSFEYYDSDENTTMQEYHDDKYCIAVIGLDTDYDFSSDKFYGGYNFTFGTCGADYGMTYKIVRIPDSSHTSFDTTIYTWIVCLPISYKYDAADLIDIELV